MKTFIATLALVFMFNLFTVFQIDTDTHRRQLERLKFVAEECADSAALFYDQAYFSRGKIVYNQLEGNKAIEYMLKSNLKLDETFTPTSGYWQDKIQVDTYYFDENTVTFPYEFEDGRTGYTKIIFEPTVIITIEAGRGRMRLPGINIDSSIRSSAYEYVN